MSGRGRPMTAEDEAWLAWALRLESTDLAWQHPYRRAERDEAAEDEYCERGMADRLPGRYASVG